MTFREKLEMWLDNPKHASGCLDGIIIFTDRDASRCKST